MLKIFKNKRAQNTAEYAILIALVVGGVVAMQTYAQRTLQARLRDASKNFRDETNAFGSTLQYEPYYTNSATPSDSRSTKTQTGKKQEDEKLNYKRSSGFVDQTNYNADLVNGTQAEKDAGL